MEYISFGWLGELKNRLFAWWHKRMSKKENKGFKKAIKWGAIFLGAAWLLKDIVENSPIHRCPNCDLVLKQGIPQCPRCGAELQWVTQ